MLSLNELTCGAGKCLGHTNTIGLCHPPLVCLPLTFSSSPKWNSIQHELQVHECNQITFGWSERNFPLQLAFPAFYELTKVFFFYWNPPWSRDDWRCSKTTRSCPNRKEEVGSAPTVVWTRHANSPSTRPWRPPIARKTEEAVDGRSHRRHACSGCRPRGHPRPIPNVENKAMQEDARKERLFLLNSKYTK